MSWKNAIVAVGAAGTLIAPVAADAGEAGTVAGLTADETRALVAEMLAETESRSSFADAKAGAMTDLTVGGYFQFRYIASFTDDEGNAPGEDDFESGFQFQRTRLFFKGTAHEDIGFLVIAAAGPNGQFSLQDAVMSYSFGDSGWSVTAGQLKLPFFREWLVSEKFILPVERSNVTQTFASLYNQGVVLKYASEQFRFSGAFSDGIRTINTAFTNDTEADYAFTARGEYLAFGEWSQFDDITSLGNEDEGLMIGLALHHQGETDSLGGLELDSLSQYTVDVNYEATNWSAMGAFVGRHYEDAAADQEFDDFGFLAQGAVFLDENWELFGRYSALLPDDDAAGDDVFNTVTVGVNNYIYGHAAKFTVDAVWFLDATTDTTMLNFGANTGTALRTSDEDNQFAIRAQFQLIF